MTALGPYLPRGTLSSRVQPTLDADGLVLRPWRDDDAAVVAEAYGEPDISHFNRRTMATEAEALEWIRRWSTRWQEESGANWAVCSSGRNVVGRVALSRVNLYEGDAELGYWVLPGDRGNAVASRAVDALARWAFGAAGLMRLQLSHSVRNQASCAVARKTGFALEGTKRSALRHADGWHDMHLHAAVRPQRSSST
ncbi:GNAT family N-acetyltransferase [Arthrobacter sp. zg-Y859]|uniref:GNAT family N-acetyltransferase n=1 Tax=Arthrobacter jinronghuae TaxID=2964609 RepID=A0ABT1NQ28_9MICC|nr:GNAT family N-acetyltransferase [Arthrobacter jinronghuae]MCQ1949697.1 GNAT family N-acetyltransferase [Arthrobacter jinronghuae]UWX79853.1 GNAT family N-acetyltransferase [Arthrobacter jinronghuae]